MSSLSKLDLGKQIEQDIKVLDTQISYHESYQYVDYRDHGYISKIYDEM